ncbi:MAG: DUF3795 domain-containing protein [Candidatus Helarchaeota archaeon]
MTEKIKLENIHAPCGIVCSYCPGWEFFKCKDKGGCRGQQGKISKFPTCKTYACVMSKGHDFCFECEEFPCEKLQPIVNFEIFTPHNSKIYNLLMIQKLGLEKWNSIYKEKSDLYYRGKKVQYGGDPLTLKEKDPNLYKKKKR